MGEVVYHAWANNPQAIGTKGLCGCTAVAVVGQFGAILGHINPSGRDLPNIDRQLNGLLHLFNQHIRPYTPYSGAFAMIFPPNLANGAPVSQFFTDYITNFMTTNIGIAPTPHPYNFEIQGLDSRAHSNIVIKRLLGGVVKTWINDAIV